ncbi:MAG TPA: MarP family serine protease [Mycobacteriales bacterium]|nr:MarP family serine protease [Mycobacteriales bacterium]
MPVLDVILLAAALLFAISGYRQGFVVGVLSFVGFLGGGVLGAKLAPDLARSAALEQFPRPFVGLAIVFLLASVGQVVATLVGGALRRRLTWHPARQVDAVAGAGVSVVSLLLVAWLVATALAGSPFRSISSQVRRSVVIGAVNDVIPSEGKRFFAGFRRLIDERGFPEVFGPLTETRVPEVAAPDPAVASRAVQVARNGILKITGVARSCSSPKAIEGTGFVFAPERLMTNAHVVAGVRNPEVEVGRNKRLRATVVHYDPGRDVAVLAVPGLDRAPLVFAGRAAAGANAVVAGYPNDGPFTASAARVRQVQRASGPDIYQKRKVVREIYALRAFVQPGNSGGPLLSPTGTVYGVIFAAAADRDDTGYALTAKEVSGAAAAGRSATQPVSTQSCD